MEGQPIDLGAYMIGDAEEADGGADGVVAVGSEIGGAWLIRQGVREKRGLAYIGAGVIAFGL